MNPNDVEDPIEELMRRQAESKPEEPEKTEAEQQFDQMFGDSDHEGSESEGELPEGKYSKID